MKTRFEPRLPRMSSWKNITLHTLNSNSGPPASGFWSRHFVTGPSKLNDCPHKSVDVCKQIWIYVFLTKNKPKLIPKVHSYISKVIWTNIIPKGTKKQICYLCPGLNRVSHWYHVYNLTNIVRWIRTLAARVRVGDFATGPSKLDNRILHKAVFGKIPVGGTNLGSSEWN